MEVFKNFLVRENFKFEESEYGLHFAYQGANFFIANNDKDKLYLQLVMPAIYDCEKNNANKNFVLYAINKVNVETKAVKMLLMSNDEVWINIEMFLDTTPVLDDFFYRLLNILHGSRRSFYEYLKE
ncbi:MAG: hypothetical protein SNG79_01685 [Rikenellaceae bacterium]